VFDAGAVLGTGIITQYVPFMVVFGLFKMSRVFRLSAFITKMNIPEANKAILNLVKLTFYLFIWFHAMACGWYYVCIQHKDKENDKGILLHWYPPIDWLNYVDS